MRRYSRPLCLLMVEIDHFKRFNHVIGHLFGDGALQRVAGTLAESVRTTDAASRYGGEEFGVVLVESGIAEGQLCRGADRGHDTRYPLREGRAGGRGDREHRSRVDGWLPGCDAPTIGTLVSAADEALYVAKRDGRDRACEVSSWGSVRESR